MGCTGWSIKSVLAEAERERELWQEGWACIGPTHTSCSPHASRLSPSHIDGAHRLLKSCWRRQRGGEGELPFPVSAATLPSHSSCGAEAGARLPVGAACQASACRGLPSYRCQGVQV
ncbi:unnamed protein product [Closterium sp. NIES-64]|nr:unnamed protein product [Closterium sp. NIES-64]